MSHSELACPHCGEDIEGPGCEFLDIGQTCAYVLVLALTGVDPDNDDEIIPARIHAFGQACAGAYHAVFIALLGLIVHKRVPEDREEFLRLALGKMKAAIGAALPEAVKLAVEVSVSEPLDKTPDAGKT